DKRRLGFCEECSGVVSKRGRGGKRYECAEGAGGVHGNRQGVQRLSRFASRIDAGQIFQDQAMIYIAIFSIGLFFSASGPPSGSFRYTASQPSYYRPVPPRPQARPQGQTAPPTPESMVDQWFIRLNALDDWFI